MTLTHSNSYTSFDGHRCLATGSLQVNALAVKRAFESGAVGPVLIFDDSTGRTVDVDTRGTDEAVAARLSVAAPVPQTSHDRGDEASEPGASRGRGRPRLGVVPREVTLLPRHWEWLGKQAGGASVALRKLVEEARKANAEKDRRHEAYERGYHFMQAIAGDLPGFEEATRALFADESPRLEKLIAHWPRDVRDHVLRLASCEAADGAPGGLPAGSGPASNQ